jgi:hypothetical protein
MTIALDWGVKFSLQFSSPAEDSHILRFVVVESRRQEQVLLCGSIAVQQLQDY